MAHSAPHSLAAAAGFVSPALSQRAIVLIGIIAFHVLLVYLLASGLGASVLQVVAPPIDIFDVPEKNIDPTPPPSPPPPLERITRIEIVKPEIPIVDPAPDDGGTRVATVPDPSPIAPARPPTRVEPIQLVGRNVLPNTEDHYPPAARRDGVEGAAIVQVCVDERGKRQGEPTITQSSGDPRLDRGAIGVARDGRYARARRGAEFVPNCYGFRVIFTMPPEK